MPHEVVLGSLYAALKALMAGSAPLTALLSTKPAPPAPAATPAIYDEGSVPQGATMPYLTIGAGTQEPWHTMGESSMLRYGWNCTYQIKVVAQGNTSASEASGLAILSKVALLLVDGKALSLAGYGSSWVEEFTVQPTIITTLAGVTTREWPAIQRAYVHDTA